ncbi:hypothetical protein ACFSUJ_35515 [Streptomyces lusitanus]|uniref:hypothetical protein n=1 Tax=Streptomyces lusitanus TaxID=68232 RepID=UPI00363DD5B1
MRAAGARIGIEFDEPEGPVDEEWQLVTVRAARANGTAAADLPAVRTGPATARLLPVLGTTWTSTTATWWSSPPPCWSAPPGEDAPQQVRERWRPGFQLLTLLDRRLHHLVDRRRLPGTRSGRPSGRT